MNPGKCLLLCLALVNVPAIAGAQTPADSLGRLKRGDTVYITRDGETVKTKFWSLTSSSLRVVNGRKLQDIDMSTVTRVERDRSAAKKGAVIGLLAGAVVVGAIAAKANDRCAGVRCNYGPGMESGAFSGLIVGFGAGTGAAAGGVAGALMKHRETVFIAPERSASSTAPPASVGTRMFSGEFLTRSGEFHAASETARLAFLHSVAGQTQQAQPRRRSWIGRHPALFGALLGAAAGAGAGAIVGHPSTTDFGEEFGRPGMVLLGAGAGTGLGSLVGMTVAVSRD